MVVYRDRIVDADNLNMILYCACVGDLEVFNGRRLKYCPKRCHFSPKGMVARSQLAVMDHNENVGRKQAVTQTGMYTVSTCTYVVPCIVFQFCNELSIYNAFHCLS